MGEYAEYAIQGAFSRGVKFPSLPPVPYHDKVDCPVCGKACGGRGMSQHEGVHQHMKFKHGIKKKWKREELIFGIGRADAVE